MPLVQTLHVKDKANILVFKVPPSAEYREIRICLADRKQITKRARLAIAASESVQIHRETFAAGGSLTLTDGGGK